MPFLEVKNVYRSFGGVIALRDISFSLKEGEILGIIGPNGSGKTTLFNLITKFLKPDEGRIIFKGEDITKYKTHHICQSGIVRTFQLVKPFNHMTALENVVVGRMYGRKPADNKKKAENEALEILEFVGLGSNKLTLAGHLTLPNRKRLELARALATKPDLLLLDEIMAGLNPTEINEAMVLIRGIKDSGITVMIVEHVMKAVLGLSERVLVISVGAMIAEGRPNEIVNNRQVIEAYLGKGSYA